MQAYISHPLSTTPSMADMPRIVLLRRFQPPDCRSSRCRFRRAGRGALLARPAGHARGRGLDLHRHHAAAARGAVQAVFAYALFALLCLAFLRVDPAEVRKHFTRPAIVAAAAAWMMLVHAAADRAGAASRSACRDRLPGLYVAMILQAAAPPVISAPTLAALMGLDAALSLATLVVCTARHAAHRARVRRAVRRRQHGDLAGRARRQAARAARRVPRSSRRWCAASPAQAWIDAPERAHRRLSASSRCSSSRSP